VMGRENFAEKDAGDLQNPGGIKKGGGSTKIASFAALGERRKWLRGGLKEQEETGSIVGDSKAPMQPGKTGGSRTLTRKKSGKGGVGKKDREKGICAILSSMRKEDTLEQLKEGRFRTR